MQVHGFDLGNLGNLVEVKIPQIECKELPHVVMVMDTSGSMGDYVSLGLNGSLPDAMLKKGYSFHDIVDVITFAFEAETLKINGKLPTIKSLQDQFFHGSGGTNMAGVFPLLTPYLNRYSNILLFAVSDGEIGDVNETLKAAKTHNGNSFGAYIDVIMVRLKTSSYSNPDTKALASLGQYSTNSQNTIYDVETNGKTRDMLFTELSELFQSHMNSQATVKIQAHGIRRSPADVPMNELNVMQRTCFLVPKDVKTIKIADQPYPIEMRETLNIHVMEFFCNFVKAQLQLQQVIGNDLAVVKNWFNKLDEQLQSPLGGEQANMSMKSRIQSLQRQCNKAIKTQIQNVLILANQNKLSNLNSQQQADYLRTSTSLALAKRTAKNQDQQLERGEVDSLQTQASKIIQVLRSCGAEFKEMEDRSFYSMNNNQEAFETLLSEDVKFDNLQDLDVLRLVGLLGVTYNHKISDCVDPYNYFIKQILGGGFLSTSDLREANSTKVNGVQAELCAPGLPGTIITGVITLRFLNPVIFDIVWQHGMKLLEMHASINMRRMLAPVRSDMLGERIALMNCIMRENCDVTVKISERDKQIFDDIRYQLHLLMQLEVNKQEFTPMMLKLSKHELIRDDLTGSHAISCINKPLIAILQLQLSDSYLKDLLHVLYEFDAYHSGRHFFASSEQRADTMKSLFQVQVEKMLTLFPLKNVPDFVEKNQEGKFRFELLTEYVNNLPIPISIELNHTVPQTWMPQRRHYAGFYRFLSGKEEAYFEISQNKYILALAASIHCGCEQDRIVDGKSQTFEWNNVESENAFLTKIIRQFYIDFYIKEATLELQRRDHAVLMTQIYLMSRSDVDFDSFVEKLTELIPNRSHAGYQLLLHEILKQNEIDTEKLKLLITGRNDENEVLFAQGNFDENFWTFKKFFNDDEWQELVELRREFGIYRYRSSNISNRHGNCNSHPSHWALFIYPTLKK